MSAQTEERPKTIEFVPLRAVRDALRNVLAEPVIQQVFKDLTGSEKEKVLLLPLTQAPLVNAVVKEFIDFETERINKIGELLGYLARELGGLLSGDSSISLVDRDKILEGLSLVLSGLGVQDEKLSGLRYLLREGDATSLLLDVHSELMIAIAAFREGTATLAQDIVSLADTTLEEWYGREEREIVLKEAYLEQALEILVSVMHGWGLLSQGITTSLDFTPLVQRDIRDAFRKSLEALMQA